MKAKILLVDDEAAIREMVEFALQNNDFDVISACDGASAQAMLHNSTPDLILLDWMLPDISGLELARLFHKDPQVREIPVIMLTARVAEDDKIRGLDAGADDYVTKPFSTRELVARINAILRRTHSTLDGELLKLKGLEINLRSHRLSIDGTPVELSPTEFRMLKLFMKHPERVFSRNQLLDKVWGSDVYVEDRTVDVHIRRLRKALAPYGYDRYVQTVRSAGYRFSSQIR